jgi:indolepyruvate ferredoxin oxidoreductase
VRPNVLGKFDEPEGDGTGGEWSMPNPSQNWLLRAKADLTPAIIAKAIAKRLKKLGVPPTSPPAWTSAWPWSPPRAQLAALK